jgi:predicted ester cyclase
MSLEEMKARGRRIADELFTQGDLAVADEILAADLVHHTSTTYVEGAEGAKQFVRALRRAFPDLRGIVEDEIAEGDKVVLRIACSGTHEGEFLGILPTGKRATWQVIDIQRMGPDGKFVEHWSTADLLGLLQQLGVAPALASPQAVGMAVEEVA